MTSSIAIKATTCLGVLGAVGGGVALYKSGVFKTETTLGDMVEKDRWILLTKKDATHINKILEAYKKDSPKATLLFEGFTGQETNAKEKLLEECKKASDKLDNDSNKEDLLKKIKKWCVIPKTVLQRLEDLNLKVLDTKAPEASGSETNEWIEKGKAHQSGNQKIQGVTTNGTEATDAKIMREECKKKNEVSSYDENFETSLEISIRWCTTKIS